MLQRSVCEAGRVWKLVEDKLYCRVCSFTFTEAQSLVFGDQECFPALVCEGVPSQMNLYDFLCLGKDRPRAFSKVTPPQRISA